MKRIEYDRRRRGPTGRWRDTFHPARRSGRYSPRHMSVSYSSFSIFGILTISMYALLIAFSVHPIKYLFICPSVRHLHTLPEGHIITNFSGRRFGFGIIPCSVPVFLTLHDNGISSAPPASRCMCPRVSLLRNAKGKLLPLPYRFCEFCR